MKTLTDAVHAVSLHAAPTLLILAASACSDLPVQPEEREQDPFTPAPFLDAGDLVCAEGTLSSGALYIVCAPDRWNRDLVVFVPGYRDPASAPALPVDQADLGETPASLLFTGLGYGFAATSFRATGVIDPDTWIAGDLVELVATAKTLLHARTGRTTRYVYQTGGSQGGLATVKAIEEHRNVFNGGLAACGPIGDYRRQIAYIGDFRAVFDYYFAPVIDGWPVLHQDLAAGNPGFVDPSDWDWAQTAGEAALEDPANAVRVQQVLDVTRAPIDAGDPESLKQTFGGLLFYSFRGTNNAIERLGGLPYGNLQTVYRGSLDDDALNAGIERFQSTADPARQARLETSGRLRRPLVTIHTTGDPIVPVWHQSRYRDKLSFLQRLLHTRITIDRYGHCNFTDAEVLAAFAVLVLKVSGYELIVPGDLLARPQARAHFERLSREYGARPQIVQE